MTTPPSTRPDPTLTEVRWLLRALRTAGWRFRQERALDGVVFWWTRRGSVLSMFSSPEIRFDEVVLSGGGINAVKVSPAWIVAHGVFAAHDLGVALGVFSDVESRRRDAVLEARLLASPDVREAVPEAHDWVCGRLADRMDRPGRVDVLDGLKERLLAYRAEVVR